MRTFSALLLSLFSGIAFGQSLDGPVTVFLSGDAALPAAVVRSLQRETEIAVSPSQIQLSWRLQNVSDQPEVYYRIALIRLRGACSPAAPFPALLRIGKPAAEALGRTQTANGQVLPMADVDCNAIRRFLDRDLRAVPARDQDELLGRALGRVLAHELYHILLRTRRHGHTGLARPMLTRAELLTPRESFSPAEEQRLAAAVLGDDDEPIGR